MLAHTHFTKQILDFDAKLDYCIPFTSEVAFLELTKQNTLIAVVLKNNNVVVYDLIAGIPRKCFHIDTGIIKNLYFLPAHEEQSPYMDSQSMEFKNKISTQIICLSDDGQVYLVDCTLLSKDEPRVIYSPK